ncbi:uncharacterized protein LOC119309345 [Triticum dicoccoides]|uniref:uncharacterized protein LOC119309345 n=1 Tax=Triticum dicoccoides TaxID=85692 RepID=UPI001890D583|nr:uncharacterized protein LOC119309345 [Triticum dicoccoides]XP_044388735.1 uncharacterized protein LOC123111919 [Triticum aestivum]
MLWIHSRGRRSRATVLAGAKEGKQESVPETYNSVDAAASESGKNHDLEEPSPKSDEVAAVSRNTTFIAAGVYDGAGSEPVLGASPSSVSSPAVVTHEDHLERSSTSDG